METEVISIFEKFSFPVALDIVLLVAIYIFGKHLMAEFQKRADETIKANEKLVSYLQQQNIDVTSALTENAKAMHENAQALNRFSMVLEAFKDVLNNIKN